MVMETNSSEPICCPKCKKELHFSGNEHEPSGSSGLWHCRQCASEYPFYEGIIHFIKEEEVFRFSRRTEFFRLINALIYTPLTNAMFILCGGWRKARHEVLEHLEIQPGYSILETGIGPGDNMRFLGDKIKDCTVYGLDNQMKMLRKCTRNAKRWKRPAKLYRANAEELPFKENSFDVVFHLGAMNLFQDKKQAIEEMIRVAKPGTRIVIADESEKASRLFAIFTGSQEPVVPPVHLVPEQMQEVTLKSIWNDYGYLITFRKPV
jgi:SAM-dependent methyltransferase